MPVRSLFGRDQIDTSDADQAAALLEARVRTARGNNRWTEIGDDLVPRGRLLVSAETDECFVRCRGTIWQTASITMVADQAPLCFFVTDSDIVFVERAPGLRTWSEYVMRQELRRAAT